MAMEVHFGMLRLMCADSWSSFIWPDAGKGDRSLDSLANGVR